MLRLYRRWQRRREYGRMLQERALEAMGYDPAHCFLLLQGGQYGAANPRLMCKRRWGR